MTIKHLMLISTQDIQLCQKLHESTPATEMVDDFWQKPIDACWFWDAFYTGYHPYPFQKRPLKTICSNFSPPIPLGDTPINRVYSTVLPNRVIDSFFESFGYQPNFECPFYSPQWVYVLEFETPDMSPEIFQIAESIHFSQVDTDIWHFYVSPYSQGFGFYNTVDKKMYVLDRDKVLQQVANPKDPKHQTYNTHLINLLNFLFVFEFEMQGHEMHQQRVANQKPRHSSFSLYNNQNQDPNQDPNQDQNQKDSK